MTEKDLEIQELRRQRDSLLQENAELREKQRWIPVSERLPDKDGNYLAVVSGDVINPPYVIIRIFYNGHFVLFTEPYEQRYVSHWMPLPETPEVGE